MRSITGIVVPFLLVLNLGMSNANASVGIGVSLTELESFFAGSYSRLYLPIHLEHLFIQPEFSFINEEDPVFLVESTVYNLGIGLFGRNNLAESYANYYGIRFGIIERELKDSFFVDTVVDTGHFYGIAYGIEYNFAKNISLGTQIGVSVNNIASLSKYTKTDAQIILRMYL